MTTELRMLVWVSLLSVVLALPPLIAQISKNGLPYAAGNRDEALPLPKWGDRALRAQWNLLANLPAFAALVLVAAAADISTAATVLGAQKFFWARLAHAVIYIAGIPYVRTLAFIVGISGLVDIARAVLSS